MQPRGRRVNEWLLQENEKVKADILTALSYFQKIFWGTGNFKKKNLEILYST